MIMHRIKQMHDKENSGVPMKTYTNENIEEFRRTMHIETYFSQQKPSSNISQLVGASKSSQLRQAAKSELEEVAHDVTKEEQV